MLAKFVGQRPPFLSWISAVAVFACLLPAVQAQVITTVAGNGNLSSGDGGPATLAGLGSPTAVAAIPGGGFYIANDVEIRRVDAAGIITRVAGSLTTGGFFGEGVPAIQARFSGIKSMALDTAGNLYIADSANARVRRIGTDGIITTVAGTGVNQFSAVAGPATQRPLRLPHAVTVAPDGSLYIADQSSVRKVGIDGVMTRIAGDGTNGSGGNFGPATLAKLNAPSGLAVSSTGTVYIADTGNLSLRRIDLAGTIQSLPVLYVPRGLAISGDGRTLYYAVDGGNRVAKLVFELLSDPVAGTGIEGFKGDGGVPTAARLNDPSGVAIDAEGRLYIADSGNGRIRRIDFNAVDTTPVINFADMVRVPEGDTGTTDVSLNWTLSPAAAGPVTFTIETADGGPGSFAPANGGIDYVAVPPTLVTVPAGQATGSITFRIIGDRNVERDQLFKVFVRDLEGARSFGGSDAFDLSVIITNDDVAPAMPFIVRHDQFFVGVDSAAKALRVTGNDTFDSQNMAGSSLTLVSAPAHGTAVILAGNMHQDGVSYTPDAGFAGTDHFRYRLCTGAGECGEALVDVFVRLAEGSPENSTGRMGQSEVLFGGARELRGLVYAATPLVAPTRVDLSLVADATPGSPWDTDDGTGFRLFSLPPVAGAPVTRRVVTDIYTPQITLVDVLVGVDANGNGRPDEAELACRDGQVGNPSCEIEITQGSSGVAYWVMAHSRTGDLAQAQLDVFDVPLVAGNGTLVATGPGNMLPGNRGKVLLSWRDDSLLTSESRMGFVRVSKAGGVPVGDFRVRRFRGYSDQEKAIQLVPGRPLLLRLSGNAQHDRVYFDVPANATQVSVASESAAEIDFAVYRQSSAIDPTQFEVPAASGSPSALVADAPGGTQSVQIPGSPQAGRWYVVPQNRSVDDAELILTLTIEAQAPVVRPGSYFNASRPGSGLFLYPAGNQWAGIWYTYDDARRPTWYYLQGLAPGANGIWRGDLYRGIWHGSAGYLTVVGQVVATPTGNDQFTLGYQLDGVAGSQPMISLGRGCPTVSGQGVDTSSNWFDPASAGRGYSLQVWANYELHAAFIYDARGRPLYLLAERSGYGGVQSVLSAEYLRGSSPTDSFFPSTRTTVGTLLRRIEGGKLQRIELDAVYSDPVESAPSTWSSVDTLQPLGGAGTTQGCAP